MRIIKPLLLGYMSALMPRRVRSHLVLSGLVGFDLLNPTALRTEQALWNTVSPLLNTASLDPWRPKQQGEVLLWGQASSPGKVPVTSMQVNMRVGTHINKKLTVHGDRYWKHHLLSTHVGEPEPFTQMPLTWQRAFGGVDEPSNPVGMGFDAVPRIERGERVQLPNIEYATDPLLHPQQRMKAARLLPADVSWPYYAGGGTYDEHWLKHQHPGVPVDFNAGCYNLADADQRISGYFKGNETIELEGLHHDHPNIISHVPTLNLYFFSKRYDHEQLSPHTSVLDSLCLFPSALLGVLIYRTVIELKGGDPETEIDGIMMGCEQPENPRGQAHYDEIYKLRTSEDRGLHALNDTQLMPPISANDQQRLAMRRDELRQERAAKRVKKEQWFAAYAVASAGRPLPENFLQPQDSDDVDDVPLISDLDHELGTVDLAAHFQALDAIFSKTRAQGLALQHQAETHFAEHAKTTAALRLATQTGDFSSFTASLNSAPTIPDPLMQETAKALSDLAQQLEHDTSLSVSQAATQTVQILHKQMLEPLKTSPLAAELDLKDVGLTLDAQDLNMPGSNMASGSSETRTQFAATLRKMAENFSGESLNPDSIANGFKQANDLDDFLESIGLASTKPTSNTDSEVGLKDLLARLHNAPPEELGKQLNDFLQKLPGQENVDRTIMQELLTQAFPVSAKAQVGTDQSAVANDLDNMLQRVKQVLSPEQISEKVKQWPDSEQMQAASARLHQVAADTVALLNTIELEPSDLEPSVQNHSVSDQLNVLSCARALALGHDDVYRLRPDLPQKTPEEAEALRLLEIFLNPPTSEETALAESQRIENMLALAKVGVAMGHGVSRQLAATAEAQFRRARQEAMAPLIEREDITEEISQQVGIIVREQLACGASLVGRDLAGADLRRANLAGMDLTGAFLDYADLRGADLTGATCKGAVFAGALLEGAIFCSADLEKANLCEVKANGADFSGANLRDAQLFKGDFTAAHFSEQ